MNFDEIHELALTVTNDGMSAVPHVRLAAVADDATHRGANPILAAVLLDPTAPEVARLRAFGRVTNVFARPCDRATVPAADVTRPPNPTAGVLRTGPSERGRRARVRDVAPNGPDRRRPRRNPRPEPSSATSFRRAAQTTCSPPTSSPTGEELPCIPNSTSPMRVSATPNAAPNTTG